MTTETVSLLPGPEPGKHDEATLLGVVEALVERARCIGELLECSRALTHDFGTQIQAFNRILRTISIRARGKSLRPLLGDIAQGALDGRPILLLFRAQFETGMERCDSRVTECRDVFGSRAPALYAIESA
jgi:hypothetical protein